LHGKLVDVNDRRSGFQDGAAATRVVFIDRGQVVETGTPVQFFSAPSTDRARQFLQRYTAAGAAAIAAS
jgi:polar amino acid transport system ATP-binding protein